MGNNYVLRQPLSLFLALALTMPPPCFGEQAEWELDYHHVFSTAISTTLPLDERVLYNYRNTPIGNGMRSEGLRKWLESEKHLAPIEAYLSALEREEPDLLIKLAKRGVDKEKIINFYAQTLVLIGMAKNGWVDLANAEFDHWQESWRRVDFRLSMYGKKHVWSTRLLEIFALAMHHLEPWTAEQIEKTDNFLLSRVEFRKGQRWQNFRKLAVWIKNDYFNLADPGFLLRKEVGLRLIYGAFFGAVLTYGYLRLIQQLPVPYQFEQNARMAIGLALLFGFPITFLSGLTFGTQSLSLYVNPLVNRFSTYMIPNGLPGCEELLKMDLRR